jgi:hypothetical protein
LAAVIFSDPAAGITHRVVSAEGAALVERQTTALFGDIKALTKQMQVGCVCAEKTGTG